MMMIVVLYRVLFAAGGIQPRDDPHAPTEPSRAPRRLRGRTSHLPTTEDRLFVLTR
jgi:hypothetical protein